MKEFLKFIKKSKKRIAEILFTHIISACGIAGFFNGSWFEEGGFGIHNLMVVLTLLVIFIVPPATWYRLYTVYKKAKKYIEN